jgi:hypothetical protein
LLRIFLAIWSFSCFHMNFGTVFSVSVKNVIGIGILIVFISSKSFLVEYLGSFIFKSYNLQVRIIDFFRSYLYLFYFFFLPYCFD